MGKLEVEVPTKSSSDQLWSVLKKTTTIFPEIFPDRYKSIDVLEGDGKSVGSVILMKYVEGTPDVTFSKERIEEVDEANKSLVYSVLEGEITSLYKTFKASVQISTKGDGSSVKWVLDYEKASADVPEPTFVKDFAVATFEGLDAYALKA
ncbi:hypothetical protein ACHQM5_008409 [Ranunculus cassubicifolius]